MKEVIEIFVENFMLTGDTYDPRRLNYKLLTVEKLTNNADGTPQMKQYYMQYDQAQGTFQDLAVQSVFTYIVDADGNLVSTVEDITWYFESGETGTTAQIVKVIA